MKYTDYIEGKTFIERAANQIEGYKLLLAHLDNVDAVADQFAGKVLNKRFFDAIEARAPKYKQPGNPQEQPLIHCGRPTESYETHALALYLNTCRYDSELRDERLYLGRGESKTQHRGTDENGRVVPAYWHKGTAAKREYYRQMIYRLEDAIKGYDDYVGSLKALKEEIARRERELNPLFRQSNYSAPADLYLKDHDGKLGGYYAREIEACKNQD